MKGKDNPKQQPIDKLAVLERQVASLKASEAKYEKATKELTAEKECLAMMFRSIADGIIVTDAEGKIVLMNAASEVLTGWTGKEATGKRLEEIFYITNGKIGKKHTEFEERVLKSAETAIFSNHTTLTAKDGTSRIISGSGSPIRNSNNEITGMVLIFRDITGKRKMEEELLKTQKLESIGILASGIAHDFNNILTAILGNVSLAKMHWHPREVIERLTDVERALVRAKELTQQLLTFSKDRAPTVKTTSIARLLKESASFALSGSRAKCEFSLPGDLWVVEIDEGQISQVIDNIVINADQAMPEGGIVKVVAENVVIGTEDFLPLKAGNYVKVSIEDRGIGIPEENLQKIFDPYFTTKQKGSGLGLAVSHSIIKNHNGHIAVESRLGIGSTFHIYLPAFPDRILPDEKEEKEELPITGNGKILVMDDEEAIRDLACKILDKFGYEVAVAIDGAEAIELYKEAKESNSPFDAVIMDLTIPGGIGGKEAIYMLREIDPEVKAIVSSGYSNDPILTDFRSYGFNGVISKPYGIKELNAVLSNVIVGDS